MSAATASAVCARLSHWAVLAAGVLITSAAARNARAVKLLRRPSVYRGTIADGRATVTVPAWFPLDYAIMTTQHGELHAKVKDLAVAHKLTPGQDEVRCEFDLRAVASQVRAKTFTLAYFPWFRFLVEPIVFEAEDGVADHVAECIRFLLAREGVAARVEPSHDSCVVHCGDDLTILLEGMESLQRIRISGADGAASAFDLEALSLLIDRRMFPQAFAMGHEMLATGGTLANMDVVESGDQLVLRALKGQG